jgi:hypothetical protein
MSAKSQKHHDGVGEIPMVNVNEIDSIISKLEIETSKFHKNAQIVNGLLERAEGKLVALRPGVKYWLSADIERSETADEYAETDEGGEVIKAYTFYEAYRIGFDRLSDEAWGLVAKVVEVRTNGSEHTLPWHRPGEGYSTHAPDKAVPIKNAPMTVRIAALEHIIELIERIMKVVAKRNSVIEKAASLLGDTTNK